VVTSVEVAQETFIVLQCACRDIDGYVKIPPNPPAVKFGIDPAGIVKLRGSARGGRYPHDQIQAIRRFQRASIPF